MTSQPRSRRIMIVLTIAAVALGGIALPAAAKGGAKVRKQHTVETTTHKGKGRSVEAKARNAGLRFVAVGHVTAVGAGTVQVRVKGGNKALRRSGAPVDFTVAVGTKVKRDGEPVTLDAIQVGDHVMVKGAKLGDVLTVRKVLASSPEEDDDASDESVDTDDSQLVDDSTDDDVVEDTSGFDDAAGTDDSTVTP